MTAVNSAAAEKSEGSIGCQLGRGHLPGYLRVSYVALQSPAAKAGVQKNDSVAAINDTPIQELSLDEARALITGAEGETVALTIRDAAGAERRLPVILSSIPEAYREAATADDPVAEIRLAHYYFSGPAAARDAAKSVEWGRKAAAHGYVPAQIHMAYLCEVGYGLPKDLKAAAVWYLAAARQGSDLAEMRIGDCYLHGRGVAQSDSDAFNWYYSAAQQDFPEAESKLGSLYQYGVGVPKNDDDAFNWYYRSAQLGYAPAQSALGYLYEFGRIVPKDPQAAVAWYTKAAQQGDAYSQYQLGACYYSGIGVPKNVGDAFHWYSSAAQQDDPEAETVLGYFYFAGIGVTKDDQKSFAWYYRAAELGDHQGEWGLASMYGGGHGVSKDAAKAWEWYQKALIGFPDDQRLKREAIHENLEAFLHSPLSSPTLDAALIMTVFQRRVLITLAILVFAYVAGVVSLSYFTFNSTGGSLKLPVALGWMGLFIEGQGMAFVGLFALGTSVRAEGLFGVTALFCSFPVIASSCGPSTKRLWKPSTVSWRALLTYGATSFLAIAAITLGYPRVYAWITHQILVQQSTIALIAKAKAGSFFLAFLVVCVFFPFAEEIIFRGYLFDALRRRIPGTISVVITALAFSLLHFQPHYIAPLFGLGLILGLARLKTDSLRLPVFIHLVNNTVSLLILGRG